MTTPASERADGDRAFDGLERVVQLVGAVVAPATLLTALLYYFGWMRTDSLFRQFGLEASVLRFSVQDYLLRSIEGIYVPAGALLIASVLGLWGHGVVARLVARGTATPTLRNLALDAALAGPVLLVLGVGGVVAPAEYRAYLLLAPCCLAVGTILCAWSRWLWQRLADVDALRGRGRSSTSGLAATVLVVLVVVLSLFWAASDFAAAVGRGLAAGIQQDLGRQPGVAVYSAQRLFLAGPGVREELLPDGPDTAYHFRYEGLRLLIETDGRLVLLPAGWTPDSGSAFVLDEKDGVRVEFRPARLA